jgi:hypothetical protein
MIIKQTNLGWIVIFRKENDKNFVRIGITGALNFCLNDKIIPAN